MTSRSITSYTVGVLGAGQLGRMLCQDGRRLGVQMVTLDAEGTPASSLSTRHEVGSFKDKDAVLKAFSKGKADVVTVEIEHVNVDALDALEAAGVSVQPTAETIRTIQDKYVQKMHMKAAGVPLGDFRVLEACDEASVVAVAKDFGYPLMLKSRRQAYDGRGNAVVANKGDIKAALKKLSGNAGGLYAERWVPFVRELAVMVVRSVVGTVRAYPVVETTHKDNICHTVLAPAMIDEGTRLRAMEAAKKAVEALPGAAGVFGVELFHTESGDILYNEMAPRPHNSGHYTIEACDTSQYEQHIRAILGLPLGSTELAVGAAFMYNVLGEGESLEKTLAPIERSLGVPGATAHWYEKKQVRDQRKMGHVTVVAPTLAEVLRRAEQIMGTPAVQTGSLPRVGIIMGSDSDLPVMKTAASILDSFQVPYELTIVSAHRTPHRMIQYAEVAHTRGIQVIIAGAGGAAHLPGMVAAVTPLPVIGVPVKGSCLDGQDSLLSIVQMPRGVPVATVAINNSTNAALLAIRILGASEPYLLTKMQQYQKDMESTVMEKVDVLDKVGWADYKVPGK